MKRKNLISALLLSTLILTSCSKVDNNIKTDKNDITQETVDKTSNEAEQSNTTTDDNGTKTSDASKEKNYDVTDEKYDDNRIKITYPQIINLNGNDKQKKINKMIKSEALLLVENCKDEGAILEVNYKITLESKNILSLQFEAYENHKGAAHPLRELYTLNVNMNKCSKLKLKDLIIIDNNLVDKFRQYKVSEPDINQASVLAFDNILRDYSMEDLLNCFDGADSSYKTSPFTFSYLTKDALGISTEDTRGVGHHVEIELKYEDIKDNLKSDNEIWKDLLNE
jgi:hypothetical protein